MVDARSPKLENGSFFAVFYSADPYYQIESLARYRKTLLRKRICSNG